MPRQNRPPRIRRLVQFWLDEQMEDDRELLGIITELRKAREFTQIVRDGIRLIRELKEGRVDMLLTLFPNVVYWLEIKLTPPPDTSGIESKLDRLEQLVMYSTIEQGGNGMVMQQANRMPQRVLPPKPDGGVDVAPDTDSSTTFFDDMLAM
jgi:hypothetical protein